MSVHWPGVGGVGKGEPGHLGGRQQLLWALATAGRRSLSCVSASALETGETCLPLAPGILIEANL